MTGSSYLAAFNPVLRAGAIQAVEDHAQSWPHHDYYQMFFTYKPVDLHSSHGHVDECGAYKRVGIG